MNAVIPKRTVEAAQGCVFYDGECSLCTGAAARFAPMLRRHHFELAPLQMPWAQKRLGLKPDEPLVEMKLLTANGQIYGGADALVQIARRIWWAWPWFALAKIPGAMSLFRAIYRRFAANRKCLGNACQVPKQNRFRDYWPLVLLPLPVLLARPVFWRLGCQATSVIFTCVPVIYAWSAWKGGKG